MFLVIALNWYQIQTNVFEKGQIQGQAQFSTSRARWNLVYNLDSTYQVEIWHTIYEVFIRTCTSDGQWTVRTCPSMTAFMTACQMNRSGRGKPDASVVLWQQLWEGREYEDYSVSECPIGPPWSVPVGTSHPPPYGNGLTTKGSRLFYIKF